MNPVEQQGMNGYGGQGMAQQITPEQYAAALNTFDTLKGRQDVMRTMARTGNGFGLLGAGLGNLLASKFGKHKDTSLGEVEQQIAAFQEQKALEAQQAAEAMAAKKAEAAYQRKRKDKAEDYAREQAGRMEIAKYKTDNAKGTQVINNMPSQGEIATEFQKKMAGKNAEKFNEWENQAYSANETLAGVRKLKEINALQSTGKLAEAQAMVGQYFGSDAGANMQAFKSISSNLVLQQAEKLKGAMSDGDIRLLESTMPNFGNDPRANAIVYDIIEDASNRSIKRFTDAEAHVQKTGKLQGYKPEFSYSRQSQAQPQKPTQQQDFSKMSDEELMAAYKAQQGR